MECRLSSRITYWGNLSGCNVIALAYATPG
jgi:hypothetical protein